MPSPAVLVDRYWLLPTELSETVAPSAGLPSLSSSRPDTVPAGSVISSTTTVAPPSTLTLSAVDSSIFWCAYCRTPLLVRNSTA